MTPHGLYWILRNPIYIGKIPWHGQYFDGVHEPIVSKDLFFEAQNLTKEKIRRKQLYKEFLLSRLIHCSDCGSKMTNSFTNKKKRRYYYYKCTKVVREGRSACSIKEVNAEKLENFIAETLERISQDKNYVEALAYKTLRNQPASSGYEPLVMSDNYNSRLTTIRIPDLW